MSGTAGGNLLPPIQIRVDGADVAQRSFDAVGAAAQRMAQQSGASLGTLRTQGEQVQTSFRGAGQTITQAGFQLQDFAVQVQGGTSALVALSQQGSQFLGIFGPGGAIAGAILAVGSFAAGLLLASDNAMTLRASEERLAETYTRNRELVNELTSATQNLAAARLTAGLADTQVELGRARLAQDRLEREREMLARENEIARRSGGTLDRGLILQNQQRLDELNFRAGRAGTLAERLQEDENRLRELRQQFISGEGLPTPPRFVEEPGGSMGGGGSRTARMSEGDRAEARKLQQEEQARLRLVAQVEREEERANERRERANERVTDNIVNYAGERFADLFDKNGRGFDGMLQTFERTAKSLFGRLAAELILRPIIAPIVQGLGLGALGGGGGGLGGLGGLVGAGGLGGGTAASTGGGGLLGQVQQLGGLTRLGGGSGGGWLSGILNYPLWSSGGGWFGPAAVSSGGFLPAGAGINSLPALSGVTTGLGASTLTVGGALTGIGGGFGVGSLVGGMVATSPARRLNSQIGAGAGAIAGAAIGSIIPGVGTVIGGLIGGALGGAGGGLIGPGRGFEGGDVAIGIGPDGLLQVVGSGGKRFDAGASEAATRQQLDQINALLSASGVRIAGDYGGFDFRGRQAIGVQGFGQSGNVFGPTEIFNRTRSFLATDNANLQTALRSGGVQSFQDIATASNFITSIYDPLTKAEEQASSWNDAIKQINTTFGTAIAEANRYGLAIEGLSSRQAEATAEFYKAHDLATRTIATSLEVRNLRAAGDAASTRRADLLAFDIGAEQERTNFEAQLRDLNLQTWNPQQYSEFTARLQATQAAERAALVRQQRAANDNGTSLFQDLTVGGLGGLSPAARYAAGLRVLQNARASGDLDQYAAAARSVLPVARDYLGTSERYAALVADVSRTTRQLGGDAMGLNVFLEGQARGNDSLERIYGLSQNQLSELRGMRAEINRLNATIETLISRRAA